jgi:hypothetical protein
MPHYRTATTAPVHLKIMVSLLLSMVVAATVGLALRSAFLLDLDIDKQIVLYQSHSR